MKRTVEIFSANCPVCDPVVKMVKDLACDQCEVTVYNLVNQCDDKICLNKMIQYGIQRVPAIAVNGKLLDCCKYEEITETTLKEAGIGQG